MAENKKSLLAEFSRKAMQRLQAKKAHKKQVLHVPSLEQDITIRSLTYNEIAECNEIDDSTDRGRSDKYGAYLAMVEPDLRAAAKEIMEAEADLPPEERTLHEPLDIMNIFEIFELNQIAAAVMKLSGVIGGQGKDVTAVKELKNS